MIVILNSTLRAELECRHPVLAPRLSFYYVMVEMAKTFMNSFSRRMDIYQATKVRKGHATITAGPRGWAT